MKEEGAEFFNQQDKELEKTIKDLKQSSLSEIIDYLVSQKIEIQSESDLLQKKAHRYKHVMKQTLGFCDGENFSLIDLINMVHEKVKAHE